MPLLKTGLTQGFNHYRAMILMSLSDLLEKHKSTLVERWFHLLADSYPPDTAKFIKAQKDPFHNPMGDAARKGLEALYNGLIQGIDRETAISFLDPIIRIRAIQQFSPAQALSFILELKFLIREHFQKELSSVALHEEVVSIERRVDDLCMLGFDIYMKCRETVYQLQNEEVRNRTFKVLKRSGLLKDIDDPAETIQANIPHAPAGKG